MFIMSYCNVLHEFQFEKVHLRSESWDGALSLTRIRGNEDWRNKQQDVMDVLLILSSVDLVGPKWWEDELVERLLWDDETKMKGMKAFRKAEYEGEGKAGKRERSILRRFFVSLALHSMPSAPGHLGRRKSFEIYCLLVPFREYHHFF